MSIIGYKKIKGLLIQFDDENQEVLEEIEKLRLEKGVSSIKPRVHIGDDLLGGNSIKPNDGDTWESQENPSGGNYHLEKIGMPEAWKITQGSKDIYIGICDGGFYNKHEDLVQ